MPVRINLDLGGMMGITKTTVGQIRRNADDVFGATSNWFRENPTAQRLIMNMRFGGGKYYESFPERVGDIIFKAQPEQIASLKNFIIDQPGGKDAWAGVEFSFISDLYKKSTKEIPETGKQFLQPFKLATLIDENKEMIKTVMPDLYPKLMQEAQYYFKVAPEFESASILKGAGAVAVLSRGIGGSAGTYLMGGAGIPVAEGVGALSAWALLSPSAKKGLRTLTKTAKYGVAKPALHLRGDAIPFEMYESR